ncbi:response regulator [Vibrio sp. SCSIO 43135]|uniref:ATP-binding protein n=1 Tax=Vibrio sp. SCSIO 43135 TaxID=2819096 RepID=UPI002075EDC5|nr:ATP-binding protein [Vibrio sp. SCSIO 43135]USD42245.1 response regulator [Vibrio sp. SCSIO 43135]
MADKSPLERKVQREIAARKEAERLLEQKALELYEANQQLQVALRQLEKQSQHDLRKFEFEEQVDSTMIQFGRAFLTNSVDDAILSNFLDQLTNSDVIETAFLNLTPNLIKTLNRTQFGHEDHARSQQTTTYIQWIDSKLHMPVEISRERVGELIFSVRVGDVDKDFIVNQMTLVLELLCSALSRQIILDSALDARLRAEESERSTKEFVAMINHELRTPLNGLLGSAELLSDTSLDDNQQIYLNNLTHSGDLLRTIINDLLDFSKISAGMMELIPTRFVWSEIENTLVGIFDSKAKEKCITFEVDTQQGFPKCFIGDAERVSQVLVNLVGNAIKFTAEGEVILRCEQSPNGIQFDVIDTGRGIAESAQQSLFDPFVQADRSRRRHFEGTGLGLAICKKLVELMNGEISFTSEVGKGTHFTVVLPLKAAKEVELNERNSADKVDRKSIQELSILVVDDIRMNLVIINQMLKKLKVTPDTQGNGVEALKAAEAKQYDLIFMDCRMPEMDGFEATQRLREQGWKIPIIALTAGTTLEEREKCIECGMDDILTKPYTAADLEAMITKWT